MDIVIAYCNQNDPEWRKQRAYILTKKENKFPSCNDHNRYTDMNTIQYLFRSIDMYMSDVNNVYLVVSGPTQVPKWVNRKTVKIVYHKDFIPSKYLPTFSARTIETFLHLIPGLSEKFLYFNDDMVMLQKCGESDFFTNDGSIKVNFVKDKSLRNNNKVYGFVYHRDVVEAAKKANINYDSLDIIRTDHGPYPLYKSVYESFYNDVKNSLDNYISTFRSDKEIDLHFRSCAYMYFTKKVKKQNKYTNYLIMPKHVDLFQDTINCFQRGKNFLSCCIQDDFKSENEARFYYNIINDALHNRFPYMCKYEWCEPALQVIVKNENKYLMEWVKHHINIGVSKIFILDNNDVDGETIPSEIQSMPQIEVRNYRGLKVIQNKAYTNIAQELKSGNTFSHLITIDADEFLMFSDRFKNVKDYLSWYKLHNANLIKLNWKSYYDDGTIYGDESIPVLKRCVNEIENNTETGMFENSNTKSIISLKNKFNGPIIWTFTSPHTPKTDKSVIIPVNNAGEYTCNTIRVSVNHTCAWVNHYRYKSTEEMCKKISRGYPDQIIKNGYISDFINRYFTINGFSNEKLECVKKYFEWFDESCINNIYDHSKPPTKTMYNYEYIKIDDE